MIDKLMKRKFANKPLRGDFMDQFLKQLAPCAKASLESAIQSVYNFLSTGNYNDSFASGYREVRHQFQRKNNVNSALVTAL